MPFEIFKRKGQNNLCSFRKIGAYMYRNLIDKLF